MTPRPSDVKTTTTAVDQVLKDLLLAIQRDAYSPTTALKIVRKRLELLERNTDAGWVLPNAVKEWMRRRGAKTGGSRA